MILTCVQSKLRQAVQKVEKLSGKNLTLPVLNSVLLTAEDQDLKLTATNLDVGIEVIVPAKVTEKGRVAVSGSLLYNFLAASADAQSIDLAVVNGNLCVANDSHTTIIKGVSPDDFPTIPRVEDGIEVKLAASGVVYGLRSVLYAASISDIKPEISSVYVYPENDLMIFAATDSFRLAEKKISLESGGEELSTLLIPHKNALEIVRVFESVEGALDISFNKNQVSLSCPGIYMTSRLVGGVFPNYKQLIPTTKKTEVVLAKKDLANALKLATLFSDKFNQISVRALPSEKLFEVRSQNPESGESNAKIEATLDGDEISLSFNARYILDAFQSIPEETISLVFNGPQRPMVMRGVGNATFTYLVMPMNK